MTLNSIRTEVIIIGAGAAGLMTAISAASRGRKVTVIESHHKLCEKIRISGGGRCNFTNLGACAERYISQNPHFIKSALRTYTQEDFINLVERHNIKYYEKKLGQLFCKESSQEIINMLLKECADLRVSIIYPCKVQSINQLEENKFQIKAEHLKDKSRLELYSESLVMASGGLSIPQIGASDFGYRIAKQFNLNIIEPKAALVPLMSLDSERNFYKSLSGVSIDSICTYKRTKKQETSFRENILFTHRGLSGPAILQISSYIDDEDSINIDLLPEKNNLVDELKSFTKNPKFSKKFLINILKENYSEIAEKFYDSFAETYKCKLKNRLATYSHGFLDTLANKLKSWAFTNQESEGFNKAEVTRGGIDTNELSSKTMAVKNNPNLYFVGELDDVTGWLGGYNFQWAWSSGYVAGQNC